jgi:hypothetical protein
VETTLLKIKNKTESNKQKVFYFISTYSKTGPFSTKAEIKFNFFVKISTSAREIMGE